MNTVFKINNIQFYYPFPEKALLNHHKRSQHERLHERKPEGALQTHDLIKDVDMTEYDSPRLSERMEKARMEREGTTR